MESRTPFLDRRVVEFFQCLPAEQLIAGGWTKSVLRRSMVGRLPAAVVWTRGKPHLGWTFTRDWIDLNPASFLGDVFPSIRSGSTSKPRPAVGQAVAIEDGPDPLLPLLELGLWLDSVST